jgi:hypothetical protein
VLVVQTSMNECHAAAGISKHSFGIGVKEFIVTWRNDSNTSTSLFNTRFGGLGGGSVQISVVSSPKTAVDDRDKFPRHSWQLRQNAEDTAIVGPAPALVLEINK